MSEWVPMSDDIDPTLWTVADLRLPNGRQVLRVGEADLPVGKGSARAPTARADNVPHGHIFGVGHERDELRALLSRPIGGALVLRLTRRLALLPRLNVPVSPSV